jgi:hypothetical protein
MAYMDNYRLKVKIGEFEFDAEGPPEIVQSQFQAFKELVVAVPAKAPTAAPEPPREPAPNNGNGRSDLASVDSALSKIMRVENRVVSLTVATETIDDAVLLLLYGQRILRNNEAPTGSEIVDGVTATGGLDMGRSDRLFERIARNGDIVVTGERRGKRYRLTNTGINRARQIAAGLIALVA